MKKTKKNKFNILGIIPARGGSKGIPKKNIKLILGKPLIAYTILAAQKSRYINKLVVSTDDRKIANIAKKYNTEVIKRPKSLSQDKSPIEDALRHAVTCLDKGGYSPDIVVWLHANVPIRKKGMIDKVIEKLIESSADSAVTCYEVSQRPEWAKIIKKGKLIAYQKPKKYRRQDLPSLYLLDGAVVAMKKKALMDLSNTSPVHAYLGRDVRPIIQDEIYSTEIDKPGDLLLASAILSILKKKK